MHDIAVHILQDYREYWNLCLESSFLKLYPGVGCMGVSKWVQVVRVMSGTYLATKTLHRTFVCYLRCMVCMQELSCNLIQPLLVTLPDWLVWYLFLTSSFLELYPKVGVSVKCNHRQSQCNTGMEWPLLQKLYMESLNDYLRCMVCIQH